MQGGPGNPSPIAASNQMKAAAHGRLDADVRLDADLVRRSQEGDLGAFGQLVLRYQDRVFNTCWRLCGNVEDARELTQETFLRALQSLRGFRRKSSFYTWLFRIAVNLTIGHRRRNRRAATYQLHEPVREADEYGQAAGLVAAQLPAGGSDPPAQAAKEELRQRVIAALGELDDEHRAVIVLRDIESLDYKQIAEVLGVPVGTVKSRLHRARLALRDKLEPWLSEE